jgi:excisionase family DNA binding protein
MELTSPQAAEVIGVAEATIRNYVERGILPARRVGLRRFIRIDVDNLRRFAVQYGYDFDEEKAQKFLSE